ncbi:MAG TPA: hypothetical protein PK640_09450 [Verrucomicrobiota bacterium]|nr:hypothetical protein [Verrucomicrobiota bacterium]
MNSSSAASLGLAALLACTGATGADRSAAPPNIILIRLDRAYDACWSAILPCLENEQAHKTAPSINPYRKLYSDQYQGPGPNNAPPEGESRRGATQGGGSAAGGAA